MDTELIDLATEPLDETGDVDGRYVSESDYWANFSDEAIHFGAGAITYPGEILSIMKPENERTPLVTLFSDGTWEYHVPS